MKTAGKIIVFALIAAIFVGAILLVGRTNWADGVREKVNKMRAERRAKMEETNRQKSNVATTVPIPALPPKSDALDNNSQNASPTPSKKQSEAKTDAQYVEKTAKNGASGHKAPGPKPPQFSVQSFAAFGGYFARLAIAALLSGFILAGVRKIRVSPKRGD